MSQNDTGPLALVETVIGVAARLEADLDETLSAHGLSRFSYRLLAALHRAGGTLPQRDLLAGVDRSAASVSSRLSRLEHLGMVVRTGAEGDRRAAVVVLTDDARTLLDAARPAVEARATRLIAALTPDDLAALDSAATRWLRWFEPDDGQAHELGVAVVGPAEADRMRRSVGLPQRTGALVVRVRSGSPAETAGLTRGDLIEAVNGSPVEAVSDLHRLVRSAGQWELAVVRGAEEHVLTALAA